VEAAGNGVGPAVELAAGMQRGEDGRNRRKTRLGHLVDRDAASVVLDRDAAIRVDRDVYPGTESGHRLINRVVDNLPNEVMQSSGAGRTDIHGRTLADGLETLENRDVLSLV
jgi:hypothetical protein